MAMVRTGEAAIASIGPETMLSASRAGLEVLSVPGTMQAVFQFWGTYKPELKDSPIAKPRVRQALSLAIDRKQIIEHVMNGKARMPYPVRHLRLHRIFQRRPLGEMGGTRPIATIRRWRRRCWPRRAIPTASS